MRRAVAAAIGALVCLRAAIGPAGAQDAVDPEARLTEKNIVLPAPSPRNQNSISSVQVANLLFASGYTSGPRWSLKGKVGRELTMEEGYQAARQAGLNLLANVRDALGSLSRVRRVVKVVGYINSPETFVDQSKVLNGFSDLLVEVFGEHNGKHARSAVGVSALPGNAPVLVEAVFETK
jgi:enamine deaminase RidA (YjgF/YER057c/UK114 family)